MSRVKSGLAVAGLLMAVSAHAQTTTIPKTTMPASFFGSPPCSTNPNTKIGSKRVLYVSPTGNDANNGLTAATAFKTVNNAFAKNLLRPGDLLLVAPGTYNESVTVRTAGAAGACITVSGTYGLARPVITWGDDHAATINVWVPYIRLAYLAVTHPEPNLNPKTRLNSANSAVDTHSEYVVDAKGVLRPTVHHVQIEDVTAYGSGCAGISFEGTDYVYAYGNVVYGNTYSQSGHCIGMTLYEPMNLDSAPGYHNYFLDNYSFGNTNLYPVAGTYTTDESGISIDDSRNLQALARNPSLPFIPYTGHTLIFGNILFGNGGQGIEIYSSDYVDIFNNVAYMDFNDPHMAGYPGNAGGELDVEYSGNIRVENNIAVAAQPTLQVLGEIGTATDQQSNLWTNNIADTGFIAIGYPNPTNVTAVNGYGVKPLFENPTTNPATAEWGFELQSKSPALGAGLLLNFAVTDSAGTSLAAGAKINMGAFVH